MDEEVEEESSEVGRERVPYTYVFHLLRTAQGRRWHFHFTVSFSPLGGERGEGLSPFSSLTGISTFRSGRRLRCTQE